MSNPIRPLALAVVLALLPAVPVASFPGTFNRGDINEDGRVSMSDALLLMRYLDDPVAGALGAKGQIAADVAPAGATTAEPDGIVDLADLLVLLRLVRGELGPPQPTLNILPTPAAGLLPSISGSTVAGADVHLFVSNGAGTIAHVDTGDANGSGDFSFSSIPLLFEGTNAFFVVSVANGYGSIASQLRSTTWTSSTTCNPTGSPSSPLTISDDEVWTNHCGDYLIPDGGLVVTSGKKLILGPGVTLRFANSTASDSLRVTSGAVQAFGAPGQEILLTSADAGSTWDGIVLTSPSSTPRSLLAHTRVEKISGVTSAISLSSSSSLRVRDSFIAATGGTAHAISATGPSVLTVDWSEVTSTSLAGTGINLNQNSTLSLIAQSKISGFFNCIDIHFGAANIIRGTELTSCSTGLRIRGNSSQIFPGNHVHANATGILIESETVQCGPLGLPSPCYVALPIIRDSTFGGSFGGSPQTHIVAGATQSWSGAILDARENHWGTTDPTEISAQIVDILDTLESDETGLDGNGLLVDFTPFADASGNLDYTYVSGEMEIDFASGLPAPIVRTGVGPLILSPGETVTVAPGTIVESYVDPMAQSDIVISGTLIANGQAGGEVVFRGAGVNPPPGEDPQPGHWWGIRFDQDSTGSELRHVRIQHAERAITATLTDISVQNTTIELPAGAGIVFDRVDDTAEVLDSTITGLLDPGPPEPQYLKGIAAGHIPGIQILDSYSTACQNPGTCGAISGNTIEGLVTGIHVAGASFPEILDNTIEHNIWGIWLEATASGEPLPAIHQNTIANNDDNPPPIPSPGFRYCAVTGEAAFPLGGADLCLSGYATTGTTVIDATENDWGATSPAGVRSAVLLAEGQRVAVDLSDFTDASGTIVPGFPSGIYSAILVDIDRSTNTMIEPASAQTFSAEFSVVEDATVLFEIFPEASTTGTALYSSNLGLRTPSSNPHSIVWDGRDVNGALVPDGAYAFVLTATGSAVTDRYDPPRNEGKDENEPGDVGEGMAINIDSQFNSFANDYLTLQYDLKQNPKRSVAYASRISANIRLRSGGEPCNPSSTPGGSTVADVWQDRPLWIGAHDFLWDGRATAGNAAGVPAGTVVVDPEIGEEGFCAAFVEPKALKQTHIIVAGTLPEVRGGGTAPEVEVLTDPFVIDPTYEQSTEISFSVDQTADVTLYILPPGEVSLGAAISTVPLGTVSGGQTRTEEWKAHGVDTNRLQTSADGSYTFALEATVSNPPSDLTTVYRGVVQVHGVDP